MFLKPEREIRLVIRIELRGATVKFVVTVDRDEESVWVAECPSIPGCVSRGLSKEEALSNIRHTIRECLELRAEHGIPLTVETCLIEVEL
jgi:predicted RNase H-like HicB family nuclease